MCVNEKGSPKSGCPFDVYESTKPQPIIVPKIGLFFLCITGMRIAEFYVANSWECLSFGMLIKFHKKKIT